MASPNSKPLINLLRGWPSPSLHPTGQLAAAAKTVLSDPGISTPALQYGPDEGYGPLRDAVAAWLARFYDCPSDPARICITGGASQNLACALQVFTDPNLTKAIWMVAPCYFMSCRIFEDAGFANRLRAVPDDGEGIDLDYLERELEKMESQSGSTQRYKPVRPWSKIYKHVIYAVPTFSNPSGTTMSLKRRTQLVHLARKYDALVMTDDVYDCLAWSTKSRNARSPESSITPKSLLPRLSDIDRELEPMPDDVKWFGHTMSNGSFSKILGPGVRTGWTDSTPALSFALSQCGSSRSGGCPSQLTAAMVCQLVSDNELEQHIMSTLCPAYQKRCKTMMDAIDKHLVPLGVIVIKESLPGKDIFGGYFIWIKLPSCIKADLLAQQAKDEENLIVAHGGLFEVWGDEDSVKLNDFVRLCFAWEEEGVFVEGIERFAAVLQRMQVGEEVESKHAPRSEDVRQPLGEI